MADQVQPSGSDQPNDPMLGATIDGKVRLSALLGKGGSGKVYSGIQVSLGRPVAVKVMRPDLDADEDRRFEDRFFREASLAGQLQHPNVVTVHDYGRDADGVCYIVMELLEGTDLKLLMKGGAIDPERTLAIFQQIVRGLRAAHRAGLVHRDVKPGNIRLVIGEDGVDFVKILDFGLVTSGADSEITQEGTFVGTPHYASPEQVRGAAADARSDLYSVGVMLYRALCGRLPYWFKNPMAIAMAQVREPYPPMSERAPDVVVAPELEDVVRRCMSKDPGDRYQTADDLLIALEQARRSLFPNSPVIPSVEDDIELPLELSDARRRHWMVGGAVGLGAAAMLWVWVAEGEQTEPVSSADVPSAVEDQEVPAAVVEPELHEVYIVFSSDPVGAEVTSDGVVLGVTPYAEIHRYDEAQLGTPQVFTLSSAGYRAATTSVDVTGDRVIEHVKLRRTTPRAIAKPVSLATSVDGVRLTADEAAGVLRLVNALSKEELRAAGVAGRQINIILDKRPFGDVGALADTPFIGPKTVESLRDAARRGAER